MKSTALLLFCAFLCLLPKTVTSIEPVSTTVAVGAAVTLSAFLAGYDTVKCTVYECCIDRWITPNFTGKLHVSMLSLYDQWQLRYIIISVLKIPQHRIEKSFSQHSYDRS